LFVTARGLHARRACRDVFERGAYVPLAASGARRESVFAFARRSDDRAVLTVVPRLIASLIPEAAGPPLGRAVWSDTRVALGDVSGSSRFRDVFTGETVEAQSIDGQLSLPLAAVFGRFPVAVLLPA
jgi:(1->4)-alpha-D-glucan 1-alpha-D-glucosylmutase